MKIKKLNSNKPSLSFYDKIPIYGPNNTVVGILTYMRIEETYISIIQDYRAANTDVRTFKNEMEMIENINCLRGKLFLGDKLRTDYKLLD